MASLVAFGGSSAALPLIERIAVREMGWISDSEFATAVGASYVTPGPIGMVAAFIGYRVAGFTGAVAATLGMFFVPWLIAASAARMVNLENRWLRGFSFGASAAVVGLQAVIAVDLSRQCTGFVFVVIAVASVALSLLTKVHPILIVIGGAVIGAFAS